MEKIKLRTPMRCQNGHFRWAYLTLVDSDSLDPFRLSWDDRLPECKYPQCPTGDFGQGFAKCGADEIAIELFDVKGVEAYEGDTVQFASGKRGVIQYERGTFAAKLNDDEDLRHLLYGWDFEIIGNVHEGIKTR
jgi:hypothetical protein